jgi:DegV family protein with EDD domain
MPVAVVTDSTAYLPDEVARARAVTVVPLVVVINDGEGQEGIDVTPADVAKALGGRRIAVTTSRPAPSAFEEAYGRLFDAGTTGIVSLHLSRELSGTYDAAVLAAAGFADRVEVVDSRGTAMGLGFPTLEAATAAASGQDLAGVREAALAAIDRTTTLFYVDTLEYLRRGGRIGPASALLGTALSVMPILSFTDGAIVLRDKVRTAGRALARLVDLAVESAGESDVDVAVHHLGSPERAGELLAELTAQFGTRLRDQYLCEIGAAVAAHVGPGFAGIVVHRRP